MEWTPLLPLLWAVLCSSTSSSRFNKFIIGQEKLNISASRDYCMKHYTDIVTLYNNKDCCILSEMINQLEGYYFVLGLQRSDEPHPKWSNGDKVDYQPALNLCQSLGKPLCAVVNTPNDVLECIACNEKQHFMCYTNGTSNITYSLVKENVTWYEAQSYCRKNYTDLVSIRNDGQKEEVKKRGMNSTTPFWIGLLYDDWKWADGGYSAYRDWNTGHPEENCTVLLNYEGYKGKLYSVSCGNVDNYPCCFKESENIHVITERKTWEQALDYCNKNYNGLLRIESAEDQKIVELNLRCSEKPVPGPVWMGLRQSRLFGFWVWTNGLAVEWSNWKGDRQPEKPLSNHCGAMAKVEGYKWSDQDCLSSFYFICE